MMVMVMVLVLCLLIVVRHCWNRRLSRLHPQNRPLLPMTSDDGDLSGKNSALYIIVNINIDESAL